MLLMLFNQLNVELNLDIFIGRTMVKVFPCAPITIGIYTSKLFSNTNLRVHELQLSFLCFVYVRQTRYNRDPVFLTILHETVVYSRCCLY